MNIGAMLHCQYHVYRRNTSLCSAVEHQRREAMVLLQNAERVAQEAALRAARQAGACGLSYTPQAHVHVNLMDVRKVRASAVAPTQSQEGQLLEARPQRP